MIKFDVFQLVILQMAVIIITAIHGVLIAIIGSLLREKGSRNDNNRK